MSTYTINKSDGTLLANVPETSINTAACSVALVGRRAVTYGEIMAENFVRVTENFANTVAPTAPMSGQLWFDKSSSTLKLFNDAAWHGVINISAGNASISTGQLISTVATGIPPIIVASTTKVTNLNADYLDGYSADENATPLTIVARDSNADIWGNVLHGIATSARYADIAERFAASEPMEPGDVVEIGGDEEICKATGNSALGVISTNPAYRMNEHAGDDDTHPFVAFTGRVPCKITGWIVKGDRVTISNIPGVAKRAGPSDFVIGRALESKETGEIAQVMIVVGVK